MPNTPSDFIKYVLRPSEKEIRDTQILFHTRHATDLTEERRKRYGNTVVYHAAILQNLRNIGLTVTPGSDPEIFFQDLHFFDYIYFTQIVDPFQGHELLIPCIAAFRGIAFLGPPATVRALSEDKILAKALAASIGIEVAGHHVISPLLPGMSDFSLPGRWVLKPRTGVMSEHITFIDSEAGWRAAIVNAANPRHAGRQFMAEEFVPGLNLAVPVIEGFPLEGFPVFLERGEPHNNILTEAGKDGQSDDYASEPYSGPGAAEASAAAARLAEALVPFDYARFDFRFEPERQRLVFLEVNMNCSMGPDSVVTRAAGLKQIDFQTLVGHVFTYSLRRQRRGLSE